jgi:hypothetical protein
VKIKSQDTTTAANTFLPRYCRQQGDAQAPPASSDLKWFRPLLKYEIIGDIIMPDFEEE